MENKGFIDSFARIETKYFLSQEGVPQTAPQGRQTYEGKMTTD
jgi:hypothetical protein